MSQRVLKLLANGRRAPSTVSPVDAVMGEDWGEVDFKGGGAVRQMMRQSLMAAHQNDIAPGGSPMAPTVPGYNAQAVVKMVRGGGARNAAGMKAQMDYLARQGGVELQRSERFMGIEIDGEEVANMVDGWNMPTDGRDKADRTSHFIVSFPQDTGTAAAERAGRAWAEQMFGSGDFGGDSFDYYTAFHTDRDHPHTHVVVHRRGLDNGTWLKVSKRSDFNYQAMRDLAAKVGQAEGIDLEATPRFARGVHDRIMPDAEYRRAAKERRAPVAPEHTPVTAVRAAAAIIHYARRFVAEAKALETQSPAIAEELRLAAKTIEHGKALSVRQGGKTEIKRKEIATMSQQLDTARAETQTRFELIDKGIADLPDPAERVRLMRQAADLKAEAAPYMKERELRDFARPAEAGRYESLAPTDDRSTAIKAEADKEVRKIAEKYGLNGDATVERYSGGAPSKGLADQYGQAEAKERELHRSQQGDREETREQRDRALSRMHTEIAAVYQDAREQAGATVEAVDQPSNGERRADARRVARNVVAEGERERIAAAAEKGGPDTDREEQERADQERKNAERKARERDGGRGL
ncbi:relaxase/mobilization nuclease domain-containing protein (plasmid) [Acuticoccus sp. MNP-M23]|uniref:relaxase/mobilization nuclease domain-containing protein n=1 Tax=Acuticoccus sp. MNP-M23 TaxID=3072793 RepID=UPI0028158F5F|nr:relaxase/mobilization nuclease domain-containing protein [Acuticoccus sp. MNP-M23]WMS45231.1 relaxase/mobilization nuclease domain-containing protein [Acuticoccus sp. MNP-M23]